MLIKSYTLRERRGQRIRNFDIPEDISNRFTAGGLSRLWRWRAITEVGTISANRKYKDEYYTTKESNINPKDFEISKSENKQRTKSLEADLRAEPKVGYIKIMGNYPEKDRDGKITVWNQEESFFVYSLDPAFDLKSFLIKLGNKYSQDSIIHSEANSGKYNLYITNTFNGDKVGTLDFTLNGSRWGTLEYITKNDQGKIVKELAEIYSDKKTRDKLRRTTNKAFWFGIKDLEKPEYLEEWLKQKESIEVTGVEDYTADYLKNKLDGNLIVQSSQYISRTKLRGGTGMFDLDSVLVGDK